MVDRRRAYERIHRIWQEIKSLWRHRTTVGGYTRRRHQELQWKYLDTSERYYQPRTERVMLSGNTLYVFSEVQMLADEAKHSIATGQFAEAQVKINRGFDILNEAAALHFHDMMTFQARRNRTQRS